MHNRRTTLESQTDRCPSRQEQMRARAEMGNRGRDEGSGFRVGRGGYLGSSLLSMLDR